MHRPNNLTINSWTPLARRSVIQSKHPWSPLTGLSLRRTGPLPTLDSRSFADSRRVLRQYGEVGQRIADPLPVNLEDLKDQTHTPVTLRAGRDRTQPRRHDEPEVVRLIRAGMNELLLLVAEDRLRPL